MPRRSRRVVVSTYQSVSGAGKEGMDELFNQAQAACSSATRSIRASSPSRSPSNVIPHIDVFMEDGSTKEEWKMMMEDQEDPRSPKIRVTATCVRVPVFVGHSEAVNMEFERPIDETEARAILSRAKGVRVLDRREDGGYITPIEIQGEDGVFVSRIRTDPTVENGLNMWGGQRQRAQGAPRSTPSRSLKS